MDDKQKFILSLKGKKYNGHLHHWANVEGEIAGLTDENNSYVLVARACKYDLFDEYIVGKEQYYTLGEYCEHSVLVKMVQSLAPLKPRILAYRYTK